MDNSGDSVRKPRRVVARKRPKRAHMTTLGHRAGTEADVRKRMRECGGYREYRANIKKIRANELIK